ncbi:phage tail protein [Leptolyngbya sp. 'hensonii']|uniref:phage tail protein n=1 Tax=Leptolyngbya sp. 'hensonii' TaxID=1922337 RepID=UPI00094FFF4D|nr:phage tail protein [Leptolyngbya sp. 'hensonii']OLP17979.1 phage tail protein [Leptolyngbya sp. 'hensonii']
MYSNTNNKPPTTNNKTNSSSTYALNYVTGNRFYVEMESTLTAWFTGCQGLGVKITTTKVQEGGVNNQERILLGPSSFSEVTLSRGLTNSLIFWGWMQQAMTGGRGLRRNINILIFNQAGQTMQCWTLLGAVPINWKAPALKADANAVAIEELTLAYEGLKVIANSGGGGITQLQQRDRLGYFSS